MFFIRLLEANRITASPTHSAQSQVRFAALSLTGPIARKVVCPRTWTIMDCSGVQGKNRCGFEPVSLSVGTSVDKDRRILFTVEPRNKVQLGWPN